MFPTLDALERTALCAGILSSVLIMLAAAALLAYLEERVRRDAWRKRMQGEWWKLPPV